MLLTFETVEHSYTSFIFSISVPQARIFVFKSVDFFVQLFDTKGSATVDVFQSSYLVSLPQQDASSLMGAMVMTIL